MLKIASIDSHIIETTKNVTDAQEETVKTLENTNKKTSIWFWVFILLLIIGVIILLYYYI
jgi:hypothetical protein